VKTKRHDGAEEARVRGKAGLREEERESLQHLQTYFLLLVVCLNISKVEFFNAGSQGSVSVE